MRVLICNHRYFLSGGPERYMFKAIDLLESRGHTVVPFSMDYENNLPSEYSKYFIKPPAGRGHVYYSDRPLSVRQKAGMFVKALYNIEARKKIKEVIKKECVDIVYIIQVVNFLYPGIIDGANDMGVPVVARLSDYQLLCPSYHFFKDGAVCEECKGGLYHALKKPCLQGSRAVTAARVLSMYLQRFRGTSRKVCAFVAPSMFLRDKLLEYGYPAGRVRWIPTFVDTASVTPDYGPGKYVLYVGNIRGHKGLDVLLRAFVGIDGVPLRIAGISTGSEAEQLGNMMREYGVGNVEFLGFRDKAELDELYRGASFVVVPSIWYENTPNVVLEAMARGKPVVGSDLGSIPELVVDGKTGRLFKPGDDRKLREIIENLWSDGAAITEMGRNARRLVETTYSPERHYSMLMEVFENAVGKRQPAAEAGR